MKWELKVYNHLPKEKEFVVCLFKILWHKNINTSFLVH